MPLYDYKCPKCAISMVDHFKHIDDPTPICAVCDVEMEQHYGRSAAVVVFKEGFFEHLAPDPMYFHNKKDLRKYCRENDLTMDYVE